MLGDIYIYVFHIFQPEGYHGFDLEIKFPSSGVVRLPTGFLLQSKRPCFSLL